MARSSTTKRPGIGAWCASSVCLVTGAIALLALVSCSDRHAAAPTAPQPTPPAGLATSPEAVATVLAACWTGRDTAAYDRLLARGFEFHFVAPDTVPIDGWPLGTFGRDEERLATARMWKTGWEGIQALDDLACSARVTAVAADDRPGKAGAWHRRVDVEMDCTLAGFWGAHRILNRCRMFVVRGDSAAVAPAAAADADSSHWFLERWDEIGLIAALSDQRRALHPLPIERATLAEMKLLYLESPGDASPLPGRQATEAWAVRVAPPRRSVP